MSETPKAETRTDSKKQARNSLSEAAVASQAAEIALWKEKSAEDEETIENLLKDGDKAQAELKAAETLVEELRTGLENWVAVKFPGKCEHGEESWYCDSCKYGWEKAMVAARKAAEELLARTPKKEEKA